MMSIAIKTAVLFMVLNINAFAGVQADKPLFKIGQSVKLRAGAYNTVSCNNYVEEDKCFATKGCVWHDCSKRVPYSWAGKKGKIINIEHRTCAKDVGDPMFANLDSCDTYNYKILVGKELFIISEYDVEKK